MFVNYYVHREAVLPPMPACLYEYVIAANGVFIRAKRPGLEALIAVAPATWPIRGLVPVQPALSLAQRVPAWMLQRMLLRAFDQGAKEILFYGQANPWRISIPEQVQSAGGVRPTNPYAGGPEVILEVHSHHGMGAFFSTTDDQDEQAGFRIFAVLGRLFDPRPQLRVRVGIYGHFWQIPAGWVFEMPDFVQDALYPEPDLVYEEVEDAA